MHLTLGLPAALQSNRREADIILHGFSTLLERADESVSTVLIATCFPNIAVAFRLLPPAHSASSRFLQAIAQCIRSPEMTPLIQQDRKIQLQLGQAFQAILASDETTSDVQELAIQLVERLFTALPESQKIAFLDELCIVDWLLETVRNGKRVAQLAVQCLQTHVFNSTSFLQHHFETGESFKFGGHKSSFQGAYLVALSTLLSIARKRQENPWLLGAIRSLVEGRKARLTAGTSSKLLISYLQDWEPDIRRLATVINLAATSICHQGSHCRSTSSHSLRWTDLVEWVEMGKRPTVQLDTTVDEGWAVGVLSIAARTFQGKAGSNSRKEPLLRILAAYLQRTRHESLAL